MFVNCFGLKFSSDFENTGGFLGVFHKSSCSALIKAVMKHLNLISSGSKLKALHASLLRIALRHSYFLKNFTISAEQRYWKMHFDGCFWGQLYFGNYPEWLLFKDSCKVYLILKILDTQILHFLLWRQVKAGRIFMDIYLSKGFDEKCKQTELALDLIQKQYLS